MEFCRRHALTAMALLRTLLSRPALPAGMRAWLHTRKVPERGAITLGHRRVYILPTRLGMMFGATLAIMLVGSINYALSLGFMLTFLLAGMALAGMVHTVRNLAQLVIIAGRAEPVFVGESAQFRLFLENGGLLVADRARRRLVRIGGGHAVPLVEGVSFTGLEQSAAGAVYATFDGEPAPTMEAHPSITFVSRPIAAVDSAARLYGILPHGDDTPPGPVGARINPATGEELRYNRQLRAYGTQPEAAAGFRRVAAIATRADGTVFFLGQGTIARVEGELNLLIEFSPEGAIKKGYPYATHIRRESVANADLFSFAADGTYAGLGDGQGDGEAPPPVGLSLEYTALVALSDGGVVLAEDRELFYVRPGQSTPTPLGIAAVAETPIVAPWLLASYGDSFSFLNAVTNIVYRAAIVVEEIP